MTSITLLYRYLYLKKKLATFAQILGNCLVYNSSRIKVHKALDPRGGESKLLTSIEMKIFRRTAEYNLLGHKWNEEIFGQLKAEQVRVKLRRNKSNCQHVSRMNSNRMPNVMLNYRINGRRRHGRP